MRIYEIQTKYDKIKIEADEIKFKDDFFHKTKNEPLIFHREGRLKAMIKDWDSLIDITEIRVKESIKF